MDKEYCRATALQNQSSLDVVSEEFAERTNAVPLFTKESNSLSIS